MGNRHDSHPGGAVEKVIEPAWLWPEPTMRLLRCEEMPGSRLSGLPAHFVGLVIATL